MTRVRRRDLVARVAAAEAAGDELFLHLRDLCSELYEMRYKPGRGPMPCCYQAVEDYRPGYESRLAKRVAGR